MLTFTVAGLDYGLTSSIYDFLFPISSPAFVLVANYPFEWNNIGSIGSSDLHLRVSFFYMSIKHL